MIGKKWFFLMCTLLAGASTTTAAAHRIADPVQHRNLQVFLIHGEGADPHPHLLTLQEAMQQRLLVVRETSNVNALTVENTSDTHEVFIQSGDIVKGGKQDRVLAVDVIVPAKSGALPIDAFCVESGRWQQRGEENAAQFASSDRRIVSKQLKLAANRERSQAAVWAQVNEVQQKLSRHVGASVQADASATSLQLSLEHGEVAASVDEYVQALSGLLDGQSDVVGYAFAINGEVNSADVYASPALFARLWPKLLRASATEAVAELDGAEAGGDKRAPVAEVQTLLDDADQGKAEERDVTARTKLVTRDSAETLVVDTLDGDRKDALHRSIVRKN